MIDVSFKVTRNRAKLKLEDVPRTAIVKSVREWAPVLVNNVYRWALMLGKLKKAPDRIQYVHAVIDRGGYRITSWPKGPVVHLIDLGVKPHDLTPIKPKPPKRLTSARLKGYEDAYNRWMQKRMARQWEKFGMHPGFPGRHFMPVALRMSAPRLERILEDNIKRALLMAEGK